MKPVSQTILHTDDGPPGDCFRACVASLLELAAEDVPHFVLNPRTWMRDCNAWLAQRGLVMVATEDRIRDVFWRGCGRVYAIAAGKSPRGPWHHSVIARLGGTDEDPVWEIVHDPHPSGAGIEGDILRLSFLVPLSPAART